MKKLLFIPLLFLAGPSHAVVLKYIQLSSATTGVNIQPGTSNYWSWTASGTIQTFNTSTMTVINSTQTGNQFLSGTTRRGTVTDFSTVTYQGAVSNGTRVDNSTAAHTGGHTYTSWTQYSASSTVTGSTIGYSAAVISGTKFDNSTTTYIGASVGGTITNNSTTTYVGASIGGTLTNNSTTTYTGGQNFRNGVNVSTTPTNDGTVFGVFGTSIVVNNLVSVSTAPGKSAAFQINASSIATNAPTYLFGTSTNDNAPTGYFGEYVSSTTAGVTHNFPTSGNYGDWASITLTPGDWDLTICWTVNAGGATVTEVTTGISVTTGNSSTGLTDGVNRFSADKGPVSGSTNENGCIANYRQSISASTTFYAKYESTYSVSTPKIGGRFTARRMR